MKRNLRAQAFGLIVGGEHTNTSEPACVEFASNVVA